MRSRCRGAAWSELLGDTDIVYIHEHWGSVVPRYGTEQAPSHCGALTYSLLQGGKTDRDSRKLDQYLVMFGRVVIPFTMRRAHNADRRIE